MITKPQIPQLVKEIRNSVTENESELCPMDKADILDMCTEFENGIFKPYYETAELIRLGNQIGQWGLLANIWTDGRDEQK